MKIVFAVFFLAVNVAAGFASETHTAIVEGYKLSESAVKGVVEQNLEQQVVNPLLAKLAKMPGASLEINVIGSADKTGTGPANDDLAAKRAYNAAEFLSENFPQAKLTNRSQGAYKGLRIVTVVWTITPPAVSPTSRKSSNELIFGIFVLVVATLTLTIIGFRRRKKEHLSEPTPAELQTQIQTDLVAETVVARLKEEWSEPDQPYIHVVPAVAQEQQRRLCRSKMGDKTCFVPLTPQETSNSKQSWVTPFFLNGEPVQRESWDNAKQAVKKFLNSPDPAHRTQIEALIANGTIKIQKKERIA